jgi:hypothetical protein
VPALGNKLYSHFDLFAFREGRPAKTGHYDRFDVWMKPDTLTGDTLLPQARDTASVSTGAMVIDVADAGSGLLTKAALIVIRRKPQAIKSIGPRQIVASQDSSSQSTTRLCSSPSKVSSSQVGWSPSDHVLTPREMQQGWRTASRNTTDRSHRIGGYGRLRHLQ